MRLALFDLDHTLIPFDSGMAWTGYLADRGVLPADAPDTYLRWCQRYVAGQASIHDVHRATVAPLAALGRPRLQAMLQGFEQAMAPRLPPDMRALVAEHQARGDLCAIVTATTRFVAEPFARLFGIGELLATQPTLDADGLPDGGIDGAPCHGPHKPAHVEAWLAGRGQRLRVGRVGRLLLVVQAMINMAVAVNLVPVTGQPLPLVSMGGTRLSFFLTR